MSGENTLTAPDEVSQIICCKYGIGKSSSQKLSAAERHSCHVISFTIAMEACTTMRGKHWMKTDILEMTIVLKRLMTMALQTKNKDELLYVILPDSLSYNFIIKCTLKHFLLLFLTSLHGLLGCYWKIARNWVMILSLKTAYWCYESFYISKLYIIRYYVSYEAW